MYRLDRKILALCKIAPDDESRPVLNSIALRDGKALATDTYSAVTLDLLSDGELPLAAEYEPVTEELVLPLAAIRATLEALPRRAAPLASRVAFVARAAGERMYKIVAGVAAESMVREVQAREGTYLTFDHAISVGSAGGVGAVGYCDAKRLINLLKVHVETGADGGDRKGPAVLRVELLKEENGDIGLFRFVTYDEDLRKTESLLMPMKVTETAAGSWITKR